MNNPEQIVKELCQTPHRGAGTEHEEIALNYLSGLFSTDFEIRREAFRTPKTYISVVWWLLLGMVAGFMLNISLPLSGAILATAFVAMAMLYFNWYASPITHFPPLVTSHNLIIRPKNAPERPQTILMAHYDTAPVSFIYQSNMVGTFRQSLIISLLLMLLGGVCCWINVFYPQAWTTYVLLGLCIYMLIQGITSTIDYFRKGYTQGASDNATGVAAAISTAENLWKAGRNDVELVITGAEEAGMIGAKAYFDTHHERIKNASLINFDTLGNGKLKIITETGSLFNIKYENILAERAKKIIEQADFQDIDLGTWHTADFDSVWFQRAGIPCLTLAALDENGRMPNIHRPEDILENVDFHPMHRAIALATALA